MQALRDAIAATPPQDPGRAGHQNNLGLALRTLAGATDDTDALAEAIQAHRNAVAATPPGHPDRPLYLGNLGDVRRAAAERDGDATALDAAIQDCRDAVGDAATAGQAA